MLHAWHKRRSLRLSRDFQLELAHRADLAHRTQRLDAVLAHDAAAFSAVALAADDTELLQAIAAPVDGRVGLPVALEVFEVALLPVLAGTARPEGVLVQVGATRRSLHVLAVAGEEVAAQGPRHDLDLLGDVDPAGKRRRCIC